MQAVILVAGRGRRIKPLSDDLPKPLIPIHGRALIEHMIMNLVSCGIKDIILVTGYLSEKIKSYVGSHCYGASIRYAQNDNYAITGTLFSLYQARHLISDDCMVFEGDVLCDSSIIQSAVNAASPNLVVVSEFTGSGDEVYVQVDEAQRLARIGKQLSRLQSIGEFVGIAKFSRQYAYYSKGMWDRDCEHGFVDFGNIEQMSYVMVKKDLWTEIDNEKNLEYAKNKIYPRISGNLLKSSQFQIKRNVLLTPGPATTTDTVKYAQVVSDICPREKEFGDLMKSICDDLVKIGEGTKHFTAVLFGGSGTAAVESMLISAVSHELKVLIINNGAYGERMTKIAQNYSIAYVEYLCDWGSLPDIDKIESILKTDNTIGSISFVHHETTTGLLNPLNEISGLARKYNKTLLVDAISSFGGIPMSLDNLYVDFLASSANKCLQGMPGVSFVICKKESLEKIKSIRRRSFYLSLYDQYEYFNKTMQTRFTPPVQTLYALRKAIDEFFIEGSVARHHRYRESWRVLRHGLQDLGFKVLTKEEEESGLVTTLLYPNHPNFDFDRLHDLLLDKGFTIYPGKVGKKETFRVCNLGAVDSTDMLHFLAALKDTMNQMDINLGP